MSVTKLNAMVVFISLMTLNMNPEQGRLAILGIYSTLN